jgi:toxin ParE1/3/4
MTVRFVEEAQREFLDAISYYEDARAGLGYRFKDQVNQSVLWISDHPELYPLRPGGYRHINLRVFPFCIPYIVRRQTLWVLAVAHGSRRPIDWISRRSKVAEQ